MLIAFIELYIVHKYAFFTFKTKSGGKGTAPTSFKTSKGSSKKKTGVTPGGAGKKFVLKRNGGGGGDGGDDDDDDDDDDNDDDDDKDEDEDEDDDDDDEKKAAKPAPAPAKPAAATLPAPAAAGVATEAKLITLLTNFCTNAGGTWDTPMKCCRNGKSIASTLVPVCK